MQIGFLPQRSAMVARTARLTDSPIASGSRRRQFVVGGARSGVRTLIEHQVDGEPVGVTLAPMISAPAGRWVTTAAWPVMIGTAARGGERELVEGR